MTPLTGLFGVGGVDPSEFGLTFLQLRLYLVFVGGDLSWRRKENKGSDLHSTQTGWRSHPGRSLTAPPLRSRSTNGTVSGTDL